ncbi:conjugal transfer protein TraG, partial [Bacillus sp. AFS098217]|uniref:DNA translocase FtsK n=1 Tax=Bacillus sp. AFS098217 TaxID=2033868 RepID=UPI000BEBCF21
GLGCYTFVRPFKEFPAQSRKYKLILTIASQTLSQLALDFTEQYMYTLLGSFRNKMIFGDVTPYDAKIFSDMFGEKEEFKESESEQGISPMQDNPVSRLGSTYQKSKEVVMSPGDIMAQGAFICAARIVQDNHVQPVQQITSNFVPKEEFSKAIIRVGEKTGQYWEMERTRLINEAVQKANPMKHVDAHNMKQIESLSPVEDGGNESETPIEKDEQQIVSLEAFKDNKVVEDIESNVGKSILSFESEQGESLEKDGIAEELYHDAKAFVIDKQQVSPSLLQRKYRIGYVQAARLVEKLEQNLVVSPYVGGSPRKVLISREERNNILPEDVSENLIGIHEEEIPKAIKPKERTILNEDKAVELEESSFKDILYDDAVTYVKETQDASASALKDKFNITDTRATRLIDALERNGIIGQDMRDHDMQVERLPNDLEVDVDITELNKDLAYTLAQHEWAPPIEQMPLGATIEIKEEPIMVTEVKEKESQEQPTSDSKESNTSKMENILEPEVARIYESISHTIQENIAQESTLQQTDEGKEEQSFSRMTIEERRKYIREQQRKMYVEEPSVLKEPATKKNTSNASDPHLNNIFDNM